MPVLSRDQFGVIRHPSADPMADTPEAPWAGVTSASHLFADEREASLLPGAPLHSDQTSMEPDKVEALRRDPVDEPVTVVEHPENGELWLWDGHHRWAANSAEQRPTRAVIATPRR